MCPDSASEAILETPVTWAQFEAHLRHALNTDARLGDKKSVLDIGEGIGFASRCGLITCDWLGAADDEKLPERVVLKIPSSLLFRKFLPALMDAEEEAKMESNLRNLHNTEVASYEFYQEFEGLSLPRCYYGIHFGDEEGQLCLEFVANSRMMNFHDRHTVLQLTQVARALGKIHACSLKKEPTAPGLNTNLFADFYNSRTKAYSETFNGIFVVDNSEKTSDLMVRIDAILPAYHDTNLPMTLHKQLGMRPVLVNGDLRTENVLLDGETGDLRALIDWQCTHLGVGVEDLHRIMLFALSSEDRRVATPMLVEVMYNSMVENLDGAKPPYTLGTLLLLSDILFPHCALFFAAAGITLVQRLQKCLTASEGETAKRKEVMLDKVIGAFEDILELDSKNKNNIGNLKFKDE